jgi:hypothetical protein
MSKGFWLRASVTVWAVSAASACLAEVLRVEANAGVSTSLVALDDQALKQVHGAGIDDDTLRQLSQLGQSGHGGLKQSSDEQRRQAAANNAQNNAALLAALELQTNVAPRLAAAAVNTVSTAAQLGGTLVALTPLTALVPIGLPLLGLPTLPSTHNSGH